MAAEVYPNLLGWPDTIHGQGLLDRQPFCPVYHVIIASVYLGHVLCSMCLCFASLSSDSRSSMRNTFVVLPYCSRSLLLMTLSWMISETKRDDVFSIHIDIGVNTESGTQKTELYKEKLKRNCESMQRKDVMPDRH